MPLLLPSPGDRVSEQIEGWITENRMKPGDTLPSELHMSELFKTNRTTLRNALRKLNQHGVVHSDHGEAHRVAEPRVIRDLTDITPFSKVISDLGGELTSRQISLEKLGAGSDVASRLGIDDGESMYRLIRVRYLDDKPLILEITSLAEARFPGFDRFNFGQVTLYATLEDAYGVHIQSGQETFRLVNAGDQESDLLGVSPGTPLLELDGETFDEHGEPVEAFSSWMLPQSVEFRSVIYRMPLDRHTENR